MGSKNGKREKETKRAAQQEEPRAPEVARHSAKETPRLKDRFRKEVAPALMKEFDFTNPMAVPHLHKIVVNMGVGEATQNAKILDPAVNELGQITGQKPWSRAPRSRLRRSRSAKACRLARWSRCAATACTSFSIAW